MKDLSIRQAVLLFSIFLIFLGLMTSCGDVLDEELENQMASEGNVEKAFEGSDGLERFIIDLNDADSTDLVCGSPSIFSLYISCTESYRNDSGCIVRQHYRNCVITIDGAACNDIGGSSVFCPKGPQYSSGGDAWGGQN